MNFVFVVINHWFIPLMSNVSKVFLLNARLVFSTYIDLCSMQYRWWATLIVWQTVCLLTDIVSPVCGHCKAFADLSVLLVLQLYLMHFLLDGISVFQGWEGRWPLVLPAHLWCSWVIWLWQYVCLVVVPSRGVMTVKYANVSTLFWLFLACQFHGWWLEELVVHLQWMWYFPYYWEWQDLVLFCTHPRFFSLYPFCLQK